MMTGTATGTLRERERQFGGKLIPLYVCVCVCVRECAHRGLSNLVVLWTEAAQGVRLCYCITEQQLLPDVSLWRWCGTHAEHIWLGRVLPGSAWQQHHTALQTVTRRGQGLL